jgi:hypothetical protein
MNLRDLAVSLPLQSLGNLLRWLDEAEAYAEQRGFDAEVLLSSRLAPDMFPLVRQIQTTADAAKFLGARVCAVEPPKHPDTETTLAELRQRLESVRSFLSELPEELPDDAAERVLRLPLLPEGKAVKAGAYVRQFAIPNLHFHLVTTYALLRQAGVPLGKRTFLGALDLIDVD